MKITMMVEVVMMMVMTNVKMTKMVEVVITFFFTFGDSADHHCDSNGNVSCALFLAICLLVIV